MPMPTGVCRSLWLVLQISEFSLSYVRAMVAGKRISAASTFNHSPSAGAILQALSDAEIDGAKYDADLPERVLNTMY